MEFWKGAYTTEQSCEVRPRTDLQIGEASFYGENDSSKVDCNGKKCTENEGNHWNHLVDKLNSVV